MSRAWSTALLFGSSSAKKSRPIPSIHPDDRPRAGEHAVGLVAAATRRDPPPVAHLHREITAETGGLLHRRGRQHQLRQRVFVVRITAVLRDDEVRFESPRHGGQHRRDAVPPGIVAGVRREWHVDDRALPVSDSDVLLVPCSREQRLG